MIDADGKRLPCERCGTGLWYAERLQQFCRRCATELGLRRICDRPGAFEIDDQELGEMVHDLFNGERTWDDACARLPELANLSNGTAHVGAELTIDALLQAQAELDARVQRARLRSLGLETAHDRAARRRRAVLELINEDLAARRVQLPRGERMEWCAVDTPPDKPGA